MTRYVINRLIAEWHSCVMLHNGCAGTAGRSCKRQDGGSEDKTTLGYDLIKLNSVLRSGLSQTSLSTVMPAMFDDIINMISWYIRVPYSGQICHRLVLILAEASLRVVPICLPLCQTGTQIIIKMYMEQCLTSQMSSAHLTALWCCKSSECLWVCLCEPKKNVHTTNEQAIWTSNMV